MTVKVGINVSELYRQQARDWQKAAEFARRKAIDNEVKDRFATKDEHWCVGYWREVAGKRQYKLETIEPFIKAGILRTQGGSEKECVAKMHMELAKYYLYRGNKDWDACLDRAAEATIKVAEWIKR